MVPTPAARCVWLEAVALAVLRGREIVTRQMPLERLVGLAIDERDDVIFDFVHIALDLGRERSIGACTNGAGVERRDAPTGMTGGALGGGSGSRAGLPQENTHAPQDGPRAQLHYEPNYF